MALTITIPGDRFIVFDVIFLKSETISTTDASLIGLQSFIFSSPYLTVPILSSPLNTPERTDTSSNPSIASPTNSQPRCKSPKNSPRRPKSPKNSPKNSPVRAEPIRRLQAYCLAEICGGNCQISFLLDYKKEILREDETMRDFETHEWNDAAEEKIAWLKITYDAEPFQGPLDSATRRLLQFTWKMKDEFGGGITRGYAKKRLVRPNTSEKRAYMHIMDVMALRTWGDKDVTFEQWGIKEEDFATEEELLDRAEEYMVYELYDNRSLHSD